MVVVVTVVVVVASGGSTEVAAVDVEVSPHAAHNTTAATQAETALLTTENLHVTATYFFFLLRESSLIHLANPMMHTTPPAGKVKIISQGRAPSDEELSSQTPAPAKMAATATINNGANARRIPMTKTTQPLLWLGECNGKEGGGGGHSELFDIGQTYLSSCCDGVTLRCIR